MRWLKYSEYNNIYYLESIKFLDKIKISENSLKKNSKWYFYFYQTSEDCNIQIFFYEYWNVSLHCYVTRIIHYIIAMGNSLISIQLDHLLY